MSTSDFSTDATQIAVLGAAATHTRTGFKGVVIGVTHYIDSAPQALVEAPDLKDGKVLDSWFPLSALELAAPVAG